MTQGKKKMLMVAIVFVIVLAAIWAYLALAKQQSNNLGYLVRQNRSENAETVLCEQIRKTERDPEYG